MQKVSSRLGIFKFKDLSTGFVFSIVAIITFYISFFPLRQVVFLYGALVVDLTLPTAIMMFIGLYLALGWLCYITLGFICSFHLKNKNIEGANQKVSVIIGARDEENVVGELISDLKNQTYGNWEALIVCHNCRDKTYEVCKIHAEKDSRIKPLRFDVGCGKPVALNYGLKYATGDIIAVFDADSRIDKDFFSEMLSYFPEFDAVQSRIVASNSNYNFITKLVDLEYRCFTDLIQYSRSYVGIGNLLGGTGQMVKKKVLKEVGGWDDSCLVEDFDLTFKLLENGFKIAFAPQTNVYDEKPASWTSLFKQRSRWLQGDYQVVKKHFFKAFPRLDILHLILSPIGLFFWLYSYFSVIFYTTGGLILSTYLPFNVWVPLFLLQNFVILLRLIREKGVRHIVWFPFLFLFNYHWILAMFYSFILRRGWHETKTKHGYR